MTWHPGTWRHFVASRAAQRDARAIRLVRQRERARADREVVVAEVAEIVEPLQNEQVAGIFEYARWQAEQYRAGAWADGRTNLHPRRSTHKHHE